ncbi:coiled-coil domain-containing protein 181 [Sorex araneus]|uniref:coiled-coil domain-containing protein 181 n=1 Tax=Sorex araneus TaxID=42254 RepID=UPI00064AF37E|nr:coiled-coil domain-containing protein 181 [Sorex araneus]XP_054977357.1 coiled-coil domain-containing protein 181 [Sorex araneus]XP_054977358.1 coiled-coil domain-containing protein 181 [Sorex araneus]XP_054977359.1 coiled-coil domain-containing protein 181 [Sorex araneus]
MNDNPETNSKESGEYEDDFEKDLEWLINEKDPSENVGAEAEEHVSHGAEPTRVPQDAEPPAAPPRDDGPARRSDFISVPSIQPLEPASDSDSENSSQESRLDGRREEDEDEDVRRYIMEKIVQANRLLLRQQPAQERRDRRLKFKDKLVDLEVPAPEDTEAAPAGGGEDPVSDPLSRLCLLAGEPGQAQAPPALPDPAPPEEVKVDGKVLVERDGKFELLNFQDLESQGLPAPAPPGPGADGDTPQAGRRLASPVGSEPGKEEPVVGTPGPVLAPPEEPRADTPQPQAAPSPRLRPASTVSSDPWKGAGRLHPRAQSAHLSPASSTYCLSPQQKEMQRRLEEKRAKLRMEEEQKKLEEEKEKKKENDLVFKAWLQKKREQVLEMRRVQRAKQLEDLHSRQENRDPQQAFRLWLKKKHEEQLRDRRTEEIRKQEECLYFLKGTEGRERAFRQWLRRKQIEKLAEQQMAKERTRQLRQEAKRLKQRQNAYMAEAKAFRFTDPYK